jgi:uncharacterized membrane protein YkoI
MHRINTAHERREQDYRLQINMHRNWLSLYASSLGKEKYEPQDFYKFPEEEKEDQEKERKKLTPEEAEKLALERFKPRQR